MSNLFVLGSERGARLELSEPTRDSDGMVVHVNATFFDSGITASARIDLDSYVKDPLGLVAVFDEMAREWEGWRGAKLWKAMESPFALAFSHDGLGHVTAELELSSGWLPPQWTVRAALQNLAGDLSRLASDARAFLLGIRD